MPKRASKKDDERTITITELPLVALRETVIFPEMIVPLQVGRDKSVAALNAAVAEGGRIALVTQRQADQEDITDPAQLYGIGTVAKIAQVVQLQDGTVRAIIQGQARMRLHGFATTEPFIRGRELTVSVLGDEALGVTELKPVAGFYDYDAKYTDGMTEHVCPAGIPDEIRDAAMAVALKAHRLLGCKGASRADFRWDDEQGEAGLYLLEVNTQPGMTPLSLVPEQAKARGIDYPTLVERIVEAAL